MMITNVISSVTGLGKMGEAVGNLRRREVTKAAHNILEGMSRAVLCLVALRTTDYVLYQGTDYIALSLQSVRQQVREYDACAVGGPNGVVDKVMSFCVNFDYMRGKPEFVRYDRDTCFRQLFATPDDFFSKMIAAMPDTGVAKLLAANAGQYCASSTTDKVSQEYFKKCASSLLEKDGLSILGRIFGFTYRP